LQEIPEALLSPAAEGFFAPGHQTVSSQGTVFPFLMASPLLDSQTNWCSYERLSFPTPEIMEIASPSRHFLRTIVLSSLGLCSADAAVTVLYSTGFDSPTYSDGGLIGQDGWLITGSSVTNVVNVANTATDGTVSLTTTGQDVRHTFAPAATTGSVFLSAEITVGSAGTGDYFIHLSDGGTSNFYARTYIQASGAGFVMALGTSSGTAGLVYGSTVLNFNTSYSLLVRYNFVAGTGNDTGALYINPTTTDGTGDTAYVAATTTGADATSIAGVNLRQGTTGSAPGVVIDNISVFVPEPSVAALGGLGVLALLRRRRI
jgi:hypothetical protein